MSSPITADVVTLGESMVLMQPMSEGSLAYAPLFTRSIAGAESNVSIGLSRLGFKVRWISRLGADPFGDAILSTLAGEGIDVSLVARDDGYPTAIYFKEFKGYGDPNVYYYRKGSAVSRLTPRDIENSWLQGAKHLHVTGITPALGPETGDAVKELMKQARQLGMTISFDPNLRRKLWTEEEARAMLLSLIPLCDIFLPGIEEAEFLIGERSEEEYGSRFLELGAKSVILKLGERGSVGFVAERSPVKADPFPVSRIVDTVGAGDAFAAGFLSGFLENGDLAQGDHLLKALERANFMGSLATQYKGDWEGLPKRAELNRLLSGGREVTR
ncbi:sugar kinase [Cohnella lupini]|uniref:5-dehydro-2-deoxygluconokinase n=1 Tax=Cohnella lupini TaxID=1294267 RepID=A0A3D9IJQ4_9BACL|nr:sugar kinase [Cohnella lupini]RED61749.1 5-dehydro-2-deoxygluconokinase [Cohnella lupini]